MNSITSFVFSNDIITTLFAISITALTGTFVGNIKIFKINIGITGVLFAGIILSYIGIPYSEELIHFIRDFGLVLFVYAVGIQVGNGFFSSFKKNGLFYNISAISVIILNIIIIFLLKHILKIDNTTLIGIYCGSVTNTPSLAQAQTTASSFNILDIENISSAYALTYPGAIFSVILSMIIIRYIFKNEIEDEEKKITNINKTNITSITAIVENKNIDNIKIKEIPAIDELKIIITRVKKNNNIIVANANTVINTGDIILCVGEENNLNEFIKIVGSKANIDLKKESKKIISTRAIVTNKDIIGKHIYETKIPSYEVIITRASRSDIEFLVSDDYTFHFGDNILIVGELENIEKAIKYIGNSPKELNHPDLVPIFIGIITGILIGAIPFTLPFVSQKLTLGLAGGCLISAIIFSNLGNIGKISWYIPPASNLMLRELGIVMFLSCVGLKSGHNFFDMIINKNGYIIVLSGLFVSFIPVFVVGIILKKFYKIHYLTLCGILSGSMTDPPALSYANSTTSSNLPAISYATVYPITMFLRIVSAQIIVILLYG